MSRKTHSINGCSGSVEGDGRSEKNKVQRGTDGGTQFFAIVSEKNPKKSKKIRMIFFGKQNIEFLFEINFRKKSQENYFSKK